MTIAFFPAIAAISLPKIVFLVKAEGTARPRHEVKYISYWNPNSNIRLSKNTKRIIDKYIKWKNRSLIKKIIDLFK
jgi:hypothetical protein